MLKAILCGACGRMGHFVADGIKTQNDITVVAGVARVNTGADFPVFNSIAEVKSDADVIIDFSHISLLDTILEYATKNKIALVLATTGYSKEQIDKIKEVSKQIPVFFTFNMSIGVNLLCSLAKKAACVLGEDYNIEIIEKHHNQKLDAPSGTAIMLANAVNGVFDNKFNYEYDRHSKRQKRPINEIGIHSVRGGTIVGEHEVMFAGRDEVITVKHEAYSREVFATGAIKAAKFIVGKPAGMYDMNSILNFD